MPKYDLYNFDINSDVIVLYFAASFDNIHLIEHYEHPKRFPWKVCMLHKSSAQFLVVTDKRDTHGIWENVWVNLCLDIRHFLDRSTTEKLVHAFIFSHLDCNNGLLLGVPEAQLTRLQRVQNSAARLVTRKRKFEHVTLILRSLHWLPIRARIQFKVLTLVFKCLHGNAPAYLSELIKQYQPSRNLRSQSKNLLCEIRVKSKTFGDRAFEKMAPKLWNNLP